MKIRLDKLLAHSGYGTRKEVKELIRKGYVTINGDEIYNDDLKVDTENDEITIAEEQVNYVNLRYFCLINLRDI